jgi:hypothetical protein
MYWAEIFLANRKYMEYYFKSSESLCTVPPLPSTAERTADHVSVINNYGGAESDQEKVREY